jgi:NADPH2:quinone reductase
MYAISVIVSVQIERIIGTEVVMGGQINAAVLHGVGQVPRYERFPAPVAGDGEAVVTVAAAALKPADRLAAAGVHYAPSAFPLVAGLDGVGRLAEGTRVAFALPRPPYGGMAEQALVGEGALFPVPGGVDDVTAAGLLNGMAAGEISLDIAAVPLADVEKAWRQPAAGQRVVFVP